MGDKITTYEEAALKFAELGNHLHDYLAEAVTYDSSQYVIDMVEELQGDLIEALESGCEPRQKFFDLNTHMGATCYMLENLIEIMDKSHPDVLTVKELLGEYRKYDDIKYAGLL